MWKTPSLTLLNKFGKNMVRQFFPNKTINKRNIVQQITGHQVQFHLRQSYWELIKFLESHHRRVVFTAIGKPASGKDRQGEIASDAGVSILRTSSLLDRLPKDHEFNRTRASGKLAPSEAVAEMVINDIEERSSPTLLFLNGSPRAVSEVEVLYPKLIRMGYNILPIELYLSDELALSRRLSQLKGEARLDQGKEVERLAEYGEKTFPVFKAGRKFKVFPRKIEIDPETRPLDVAFRIKSHVESFIFGFR